jgi:hypothetical protein
MHTTVLQDSMHLLKTLALAGPDDIFIVNYSHWHKEPSSYEPVLTNFTGEEAKPFQMGQLKRPQQVNLICPA